MSSLALSLVLLIAIAVLVALVHNLRQSGWGNRGIRRENGAQRGEPRLGAVRAEGAASGPVDTSRDLPGPDSGELLAHPAMRHHSDQLPSFATGADSAGLVSPPTGAAAGAESAPDSRASGRLPENASDPQKPPLPDPSSAAGSPGGPAGMQPLSAPVGAAPATEGPAADAPSDSGQGPVLSEAADCVVELIPDMPLSGERLQMIAVRLRRAGSKPVAFDAKANDTGEFEAPVAGRSYALVRVGILLVNRHGPLNAMEFSDFIGAVQTLTETLPAQAQMPAMGPVLARARELDSICAQLDVQIGLNVEAANPIETAQLAAIARDLGLIEPISQRYVMPGPHGDPLFSLSFADTPERVTFLLDVPRVPAAMMPFARMVQAATTCARRLGGSVVDDGGRPLTQASLGQIARQLGQRYESLEAIGLPAGSGTACKVFN